MNFLAHIYLSGNNDEIMVGNFIGDWVKGQDFLKYPENIKKGIILHRDIDTFTDKHPVVKRSKSLFNEKYHKYSGIIVDIFYDHYLSKYWRHYSSIPLVKYIEEKQDILTRYFDQLPASGKDILPKFIKHRWLNSYDTIGGMEKVLRGMTKNTSLPDGTDFAIGVLEKNYEVLKNDFIEFFPQIIQHVEAKHLILVTDKI
jgi:acyl carrier protein phosphodiesterase